MFSDPEEPARSSGAKRLLFAAVIAALILVGAVAMFNPRALTDPTGALAELTGEAPAATPLDKEVESQEIAPSPDTISPPAVEDEPPVTDVTAAAPEPTPPAAAPAPNPTPVTRPSTPTRVESASVDFGSNQPGAVVTVDENEELSCTAPCRLSEIPRGMHTARASLEGFHNLSRPFEVKDEPNVTVEFEFQDSRPTALITSQPPGADIYIDGEKQAVQTNARIRLAPGEYIVRVVKEGVGQDEGTLEVIQDQTPIARFILEATQ